MIHPDMIQVTNSRFPLFLFRWLSLCARERDRLKDIKFTLRPQDTRHEKPPEECVCEHNRRRYFRV